MHDLSKTSASDVVLVSASDSGYAMPLAVTIRSTLEHLAPHRRIHLYVIDGGLTALDRSRLIASWKDPRLTLHWVAPDLRLVRDLKVSEHVNLVTYLRLLMPALLPFEVKRAIYLDADMLVRYDLGVLWDEPQGDHAALAVQDVAAPWIDAKVAAIGRAGCCPYLCAQAPVVNYLDFGISPAAKYLNGGLLVVDLARWRREKLGEKMLAALRDFPQHVLWWDQYALNAILAGKWRSLDLRWNQGAHIYNYPAWQQSPFDSDEFDLLREQPWVIHFCSPEKPWHYFCHHPFTRDWRRCLRTTDWHDWKPEKPDEYVHKLWDFYYQPLRGEWKRHVRAIKQKIRQRRGKAA
ncbi:MAG: glycosyltransferase family 8 protein [Pirellulales bacterium]|nr:glycosyltransferase family 8 protein [Pirellulales bacterium]